MRRSTPPAASRRRQSCCAADGVTRIVATGNGAAYYVAHALWLASLEGARAGPPIVAVPCGIAVRERFRLAAGDAVLAVSSSGEFRDVVEIAQRRRRAALRRDHRRAPTRRSRPRPTATVLQHVVSQRAVTHTQALAGAYACGLALWAGVTGDASSSACWRRRPAPPSALSPTPRRGRAGRSQTLAGTAGRDRRRRRHRVGGGARAALMLKEIARIPAEGVETREGATSAMFGLDRGHLMVSLDPDGDPLGDEAVRLCAAAGATTLRLPGAARVDARLAPITTLPAAAALAAELALAAGHDVDTPDLDRRLLRDREERDVSIRLGVVGCGSVFWTPYMSLIERLRGQGRVDVAAVYDVRSREAPDGRRAARPQPPTSRPTSRSAGTPTWTSCWC